MIIPKLYQGALKSDEEEPEKETPDTGTMERMLEGAFLYDKTFLKQRKIFLWGEVNEKSSRDITNRLLYLESIEPGKEISFRM